MEIKQIKPMPGRILVRKVPDEQKTVSGFVLMASTAAKTSICYVEVIAVGSNDGVDDREKIVVKPGDKGIVGRVPYEGITIDDEIYWVVKQPDIVAIIED